MAQRAPEPSAGPALPETLPTWGSPAAVREAFRWGLLRAMAGPARVLTCTAPVFDDWPLEDPAVLEAATQWLRRPARRWVLLAADYRQLPWAAPRFCRFRTLWVHAVPAWQVAPEAAPTLSASLWADSGETVELLHPEAGLGRAGCSRRDAVRLQLQTDALLQRSNPALAVNVLGL